MTYLTLQFSPTKSAASSTSARAIWSCLAGAYRQWRKQARDRADLAAMGYRDLQDVGFPMRPSRFPQTSTLS